MTKTAADLNDRKVEKLWRKIKRSELNSKRNVITINIMSIVCMVSCAFGLYILGLFLYFECIADETTWNTIRQIPVISVILDFVVNKLFAVGTFVVRLFPQLPHFIVGIVNIVAVIFIGVMAPLVCGFFIRLFACIFIRPKLPEFPSSAVSRAKLFSKTVDYWVDSRYGYHPPVCAEDIGVEDLPRSWLDTSNYLFIFSIILAVLTSICLIGTMLYPDIKEAGSINVFVNNLSIGTVLSGIVLFAVCCLVSWLAIAVICRVLLKMLHISHSRRLKMCLRWEEAAYEYWCSVDPEEKAAMEKRKAEEFCDRGDRLSHDSSVMYRDLPYYKECYEKALIGRSLGISSSDVPDSWVSDSSKDWTKDWRDNDIGHYDITDM